MPVKHNAALGRDRIGKKNKGIDKANGKCKARQKSAQWHATASLVGRVYILIAFGIVKFGCVGLNDDVLAHVFPVVEFGTVNRNAI